MQADLIERGEQVKVLTYDDTTAVQMIAIDRSGGELRMLPAADPRKGGFALVR